MKDISNAKAVAASHDELLDEALYDEVPEGGAICIGIQSQFAE